jgi:hypothetical protein
MYIHRPFDFALIRDCKSCDHIAQEDWDHLKKHSAMFENPIPQFDVLTYLIHVNCSAHDTVFVKDHCDTLMFETSQHTSESAADWLYP